MAADQCAATPPASEVDERSYPQVALAICLKHSRPHRDTSTEFHTPAGPFTLVPLPGHRSSLVWVLEPAAADELSAFDDLQLAGEIERASHSILGKLDVEPGRGLFPLSVATARHFAGKRIALVGEAAHVIPPIGAQGLNLGLRDAATIGELVSSTGSVGVAPQITSADGSCPFAPTSIAPTLVLAPNAASVATGSAVTLTATLRGASRAEGTNVLFLVKGANVPGEVGARGCDRCGDLHLHRHLLRH